MNRLRVAILVGIVGIVIGSGIALAAQTDGGPGGRDLVEASVRTPLPTPLGTFPAVLFVAGDSRSPAGVPADGQWFAQIYPTGPFADLGTVLIGGPVVCVSAAGNGANWRGIIENTNSGLAPAGYGVLGRLVDNGEAGTDPSDQTLEFLTPPPGPSPTCPPTPFTTGPRLGRVVVQDGQ